MPKLEDVYGKISVRNEKKEIIRQEIYPANFVFPKIMVKKKDGIIEYYRVDDISGGWKTLMNLAGVESLQLKDFTTYFNYLLKTKYNFTSKEAGAYIGNNEVENELHYSPYHEPTIREKMQRLPLKEVIGGS